MSADLAELIRDSVYAELDELRRTVNRIALSTEIRATVQLVACSETNPSAQLASIHEQIANVVARRSRRRTTAGVELEAVVQASETAANQIWRPPRRSAAGCWPAATPPRCRR